MAEPNPSLHIDGESSSFGLPTDTVHIQGHQRNGTVREEPTNNEIPDFFGNASRVTNQATPGVVNQTTPRFINLTTTRVQTPNYGAGR
ncbi:hypothetical protein Hanom_Chr14g01250771 [Helianthus anomalus]